MRNETSQEGFANLAKNDNLSSPLNLLSDTGPVVSYL